MHVNREKPTSKRNKIDGSNSYITNPRLHAPMITTDEELRSVSETANREQSSPIEGNGASHRNHVNSAIAVTESRRERSKPKRREENGN